MNDLLSKKVCMFPRTRYMGSKQQLNEFIYRNIKPVKFNTSLDAFSGSGTVSYLLKSMGKEVHSNDFLKFSYMIARATIQNKGTKISDKDIKLLLKKGNHKRKISRTFKGLYFSDRDNLFLDRTYANIESMPNPSKRALALAALARACLKKRPRGIFTYTGMRYDDGRNDLKMSMEEQFISSLKAFNECVFDNGKNNKAFNKDIFKHKITDYDLVYMDPPYFSLKSDNDYSRRYHFVEGLMSYWEHVQINENTKTKKFDKFPSPFDSQKSVYGAFDKIFGKFSNSHLVVSYSSNSLPSLPQMVELLKSHKKKVTVAKFDHRYSFGNQKVGLPSNKVKEYLFIAKD